MDYNQNFRIILNNIYTFLKQIEISDYTKTDFPIPKNLKYTVKSFMIGNFYKLLSGILKINTPELILTITLPFRYNPEIDYAHNIIVIGLNNSIIKETQLSSGYNEDMCVIELTDELISIYLNSQK